MKTRIFCLIVLLAVLCCGLALAADDPLKVSMQLSSYTFSEPGPVTVSIQVANSGEGDMADPVVLYYPNGKEVEEFGAPVLSVGTAKTWTGVWNVTQNQLEAGRVTFKIKYTVYDDEGNKISKSKNFYKSIDYTGAVTNIEVNRTISATTAAQGQEVTVTYAIVNTGTVAVTDVKITEDSSISSKAGTIASVAPGTREVYSFTTTMGKKNLQSKPTISYVANGETQKTTLDAATIKYGEVYLKANLTADKKGTVAGDMVTLTLTLKNSGKVDYKGLTVTDAILGKVFSDVNVAAGTTEVLTRSITLTDTADYLFTITGTDSEGTELTMSTERVPVQVLQADQVINLDVRIDADRFVVYEFPAKVTFHASVTNNSAMDVTNVVVKAAGVTLYTFPSILQGETREFSRDVHIEMPGRFQFEASLTNMLDETQRFGSNIVTINLDDPTPVPTAAPIVTPPKPNLQDVPTEIDIPENVQEMYKLSRTASYVFAGLAGLGALLLLIAIAVRVFHAIANRRIKGTFTVVTGRDYLAENGDEAQTSDTKEKQE